MTFSQDEFEAWVEDLPRQDHNIVIGRACIDLGWEREVHDDGMIVDGDIYSPEFMAAVHKRYLQMYVDDILGGLVTKGLLRPDYVNKDGEVGYVLEDGVEL